MLVQLFTYLFSCCNFGIFFYSSLRYCCCSCSFTLLSFSVLPSLSLSTHFSAHACSYDCIRHRHNYRNDLDRLTILFKVSHTTWHCIPAGVSNTGCMEFNSKMIDTSPCFTLYSRNNDNWVVTEIKWTGIRKMFALISARPVILIRMKQTSWLRLRSSSVLSRDDQCISCT